VAWTQPAHWQAGQLLTAAELNIQVAANVAPAFVALAQAAVQAEGAVMGMRSAMVAALDAASRRPPVQLQDGKAPEWTCQQCGGDVLFCGCKLEEPAAEEPCRPRRAIALRGVPRE
jgi:hypothetical protein